MPWCAPCILHDQDPALLVWDYREASRRVRTYLWFDEGDYVVILEKRPHRQGEIAWLVTAHHVDGDSTRRKLRRKYAAKEP